MSTPTSPKHQTQEVSAKVTFHHNESGITDAPSSSFEGDVETKNQKPKSSRPSRLVAAVLGLGTLAAAAVGVFLFMEKKEFSLRRPNRLQHPDYQGQVTYASMALHDVPEDCWMEIHGNVYDLTEYAPDHPGGPEYVTDYCGMEATSAFDMEHSTSLLGLIRQYNLGEAVSTLSLIEGESTMDTPATAPSNPADVGSSDDSEDSSDEEGYESPYVVPGGRSPTTTAATAPGNAVAATTVAAATTTTTKPEGCPVQYYSTATVAEHNSRFDCWYILYGNVWDFTSYVNVHPGGARRVFQYCGTDATVPYSQEKKHDQSLLAKKTPNLLIGKLGSETELRYEPC
eukprot:scaffold11051_cov165-Amphora_coffeaeformis.AAC.1